MNRSSKTSSQITDYFRSEVWRKVVAKSGGGFERKTEEAATAENRAAEVRCVAHKARAFELAQKVRSGLARNGKAMV